MRHPAFNILHCTTETSIHKWAFNLCFLHFCSIDWLVVNTISMLLFDGVMERNFCLCKCYNAYISIETPIFLISFLTQNNFFYFSFDATYYIAAISYFGCSKHHVQFSLMLHAVTIILMRFTLVVPFLCICFTIFLQAKIGNFNAEKFDVPHIAPKNKLLIA